MSRHRAFRHLLPIVLVAATFVGCSSNASVNYVAVTGRLPELHGASLTGGSVSAATYAGRVVVVNFWNPYCSPCRQEQRTLQRASLSLMGDGVVVIGVHAWGVSYPYRLSAANDYLREFGVTYPVLDDPNRAVIHSFGVEDIPTTLVADSDGNLRFKVLGPVEPGELERLVRMASTPPGG
jgi:thiol-disulfide isomerase/thioredoxin